MIAAIERGDYAAAAAEALDSKWAGQTPVRAEDLAAALNKAAETKASSTDPTASGQPVPGEIPPDSLGYVESNPLAKLLGNDSPEARIINADTGLTTIEEQAKEAAEKSGGLNDPIARHYEIIGEMRKNPANQINGVYDERLTWNSGHPAHKAALAEQEAAAAAAAVLIVKAAKDESSGSDGSAPGAGAEPGGSGSGIITPSAVTTPATSGGPGGGYDGSSTTYTPPSSSSSSSSSGGWGSSGGPGGCLLYTSPSPRDS